MKEQVEKIIREAGAILMQHFGKTVNGRDKAFKGDVESVADLECEAYIVRELQRIFSGDAILTEEHTTEYLNGYILLSPGLRPPSPLGRGEGEGRLWIVDALDGSRNFLRGISNFGISIGYIVNDAPYFGMVYFPGLNELCWAERSKGAFLNGQSMHVAQEQEVDRMFSSMFFGPQDVPRNVDKYAILARYEERRAWNVNPGPFVTAACYVASGRLDAGIWTGMYVWDTAATGLILQEAGAKVTDLKGNLWYWGSDPQDIVAANPVLHEKIMREVIQLNHPS